MQVKVGNGIPRIITHIHDQAIPTREALGPCHFICRVEEIGQQGPMLATELRGVLDVLSGNHEHVSRRLFVDVSKRHHMFITSNFFRRDLPRHDLAKQAIFHPLNLPGARFALVDTLDCVDNDSLNRALQEWTADTRIEQARTQRQARQWEKQAAGEEARFSGLLIDLHERNCFLSVTSEGGRTLPGFINELGSDFALIADLRGTRTFLRLSAITAVELEGTANTLGTPSLRVVEDRRNFDAVLSELAAERHRVRFATKNSNDLRTGTITAAGIDVVTVEISGPPVRTLFISSEQLSEISLNA